MEKKTSIISWSEAEQSRREKIIPYLSEEKIMARFNEIIPDLDKREFNSTTKIGLFSVLCVNKYDGQGGYDLKATLHGQELVKYTKSESEGEIFKFFGVDGQGSSSIMMTRKDGNVSIVCSSFGRSPKVIDEMDSGDLRNVAVTFGLMEAED